jgi:hypothetical protein
MPAGNTGVKETNIRLSGWHPLAMWNGEWLCGRSEEPGGQRGIKSAINKEQHWWNLEFTSQFQLPSLVLTLNLNRIFTEDVKSPHVPSGELCSIRDIGNFAFS